jgi:hypothetical protein
VSTVSQVITRTQRQLLSGVVEERNKLSATITATATSCVLTYDLGSVRQGSVLEIDSEQVYVWDVIESSKTLTIERGFNGTTAAAHTGGSVCVINPRFPRNQILEAINDELADLSSPVNGLFQVKNLDLTYNSSNRQMNLPTVTDVIDLIDVRYRYRADDYKQVSQYKLLRNLPTKDFGSGIGLQIDSDVSNGDLRVTFKAPFGKVTAEADDLQNISGFPLAAEDILVIGAQIRLMAPREVKRNFTESQGDTRRSDEVPSGAVANSITNLLRMRRDRITAEAQRLARLYPTFLQRA